MRGYPRRLLPFILLVFLLSPARASVAVSHKTWTSEWNSCFAAAGARYQIEPVLLKSIAAAESSLVPDAVNVNRSKKTGKPVSRDYGLMQINSAHIPRLQKMGVIKEPGELLRKPCLNIQIGAWILAAHFQVCGVSWNCLGSYNAGFRDELNETRERYAGRVWRIYRDMKGLCLPDKGGWRCIPS
ncbi:lytic transglycosylase [Salmonella enterica]|uniref:Lytic transglycosylase domain-containing protein n=1 Tax=Salmonella enterica TaxID=28901 RepID=A0A742UFY1_SALER|nr:lytic transglycosylase [Salmonella enterica subsp. enterica serovar Enteritidis]EAQ3014330.1 lytic transglycosylase [Salmonella enterica]EBX8423516.1 lytic transglycosylase [Salmonella enterica subsp. enterica serovar Urbana]ECZ5203303.1 lytic transglycosylase domain-containing protein [Salmonella enterica subsp. enterica serovar Kentucky]EDD6035981.1 transglycosylase SLT domain-containing protein [Salmonella enterica subsp. enterica serovar Stanley]HBZ8552078.1 lytic transglycosylase domai